jgi:hypothetical protein
MCARSGVD